MPDEFIKERYPLSPMQQGMLFHSLYAEQAGIYVQQLVCRLREELNVPAFESAWLKVLERHQILRTSFQLEGDNVPLQEVHLQIELPLEQHDWRALSARDCDERLKTYLESDRRRGFKVTDVPLMRLALFRIADNDYTLIWTSHHALLDGRSRLLVLNELFGFYESHQRGEDLRLEPVAPYREYIDWLGQRDWTAAEQFWKQRLKGFTQPTLINVAQNGAVPKHEGFEELQLRLTSDESLALRTFAQDYELTLNTIFQGVWALLLSHYSGADEVVFGATRSCRRTAGLGVDTMVGLLINTLPVRAQVRADLLLGCWLKELREQHLTLREHEHTPLVKIHEWSDIHKGSQLFQSILIFEKYELDSTLRAQAGWENRHFRLHERTNYPIMICGYDGPELLLKMIYDHRIFDGRTAEQMMGHLRNLLVAVPRYADKPVSLLPLLSETEQDRIVRDWNATAVEYPQELCVHELFAAQLARTPEAEALVVGEERLSYRELGRRAEELARRLRAAGVGAERRVGVLVGRSVALVVAVLGVLKAGGAYVPLDVSYPEERLRLMIEDAELSVLVAEEGLAREFVSAAVSVVLLDGVSGECVAREGERAVGEPGAGLAESAVRAENLAYVIYTSGSTGRPKGVAISHRSAVAFIHWAHEIFSTADLAGVLASTSLCFDLSVFELFVTLSGGGKIILAENALHLATLPAAAEVTLINTVPSAMAELLRMGGVPGSVRTINLAGEALPRALVQQIYEQTSVGQVHNLYGPSEDTTYSTYAFISEKENEPVVIGRPIANTQAYICDGQLRPVPIGVTGQLLLAGAGLARGYLGRAALTAERFIPNPFATSAGERLYQTGDQARYLADGRIEFLGRNDHQVKVRGYRVEPGEIEAALAGHERVRCCCVVAQGEGSERRLVAYIVAQEEAGVGRGPVTGLREELVQELRGHLRGRLPEYMVPSHFVGLESLPLTPNGKVDRQALPAVEWRGAEQGQRPRTTVEEVLTGIWSEVLQVERVGVEEDFFELGGHSLLATRVMVRVREALGVEVTLASLFEHRTVAALARHLESILLAGRQFPPLRPAPREKHLPLSFAQERLWLLDQLEPASNTYNIPIFMRLQGSLNVAALERALGEIVRRHEVLRTTFKLAGDQPVQIIAPASQSNLTLVDLSEEESLTRELVMERFAQDEARRPFDLSLGPLLRTCMLRMSETDHVLLTTMHHAISDGWSLRVFRSELAVLYNSYLNGQPSPLLEQTIQYADFAVWQKEWLQGEVLEEHLSYWTRQFSDAPSVLELPTDRPRPAMQSFRGARRRFTVEESLWRELKGLAQSEGCTVFMVLMGVSAVLLNRYADQDDIVIGTPIANRSHSETEGLIGCFVNTVALRVDLSGDPSFRQLMRRVRDVALGAYAHQDMPFEKLVEALQPERNLSHSPLFQVMLAMQSLPQINAEFAGVEISPVEVDSGVAKFELTLEFTEHEDGLAGSFQYNTDIFDGRTAEQMMGHLRNLLVAVPRYADKPVSLLPLLSETEQDRIVRDWNATAAEYPQELCVHELFAAQLARTPEAEALVVGEERLSYRELGRRAEELARRLRAAGVGAERRVGVLVGRSVALVVAVLGVLKAGGAYVPLDVSYPEERLRLMIEDAELSVLVAEEGLAREFVSAAVSVVLLDGVSGECVAREGERAVGEPGAGLAESAVRAENLAYVIYTSGSTGRPKGVAISHRSAVAFIHWAHEIFSTADLAGVLASTSLCFDLSVFELFVTLSGGGKIILAENALHLATLPAAAEVTLINTVPSAMAELLRMGGVPGSVRTINLAGEALPRALVQQIYEQTSVGQVHNLYGPSEDTTYSTYAFISEQENEPVVIGRPIANTQAYICDGQLRPVPIGVTGQLLLAGAGLARGYLGRAALTAERFIPNPFATSAGERLYQTGDQARYLADGRIEFLGRNDHQVKVRGYRVEPGEIEAALAGHERVRCCCVVAQGEGSERRLVAYIVAQEEAGVGRGPVTGLREELVQELRGHLRGRLPEYMVPSHFVGLESLPLTPNGKVDRQALPAVEWRGAEQGQRPRTTVEEVLTGIWSEVLQVERVGVEEDFFELGGHSLLATRVMVRVREALGVEVTLASLFEHRTVAALARHLESMLLAGTTFSSSCIKCIPKEQGMFLSLEQEMCLLREWWEDLHSIQRRPFHLVAAFSLVGDLDAAALEKSVNEVVRRHEVLRASFPTVPGLFFLKPLNPILKRVFSIKGVEKRLKRYGAKTATKAAAPGIIGGPTLRVDPGVTLRIPIIDLTGVKEDERKAKSLRLITEEARRPFDYDKGTLLRVLVFRLAENEYTLCIVMHHLISDAWSLNIFIKEVAAFYEKFSKGKHVQLPLPPIQYRDYARWQRDLLQGETLNRMLSYWHDRLTPIRLFPQVKLTFTKKHAPSSDYQKSAEQHKVMLSRELSDALKNLRQQHGCTMFMLLLAAFKALLHRYSGEELISVLSPFANRSRMETHSLIGWFATGHALTTKICGDPCFVDLLHQVRESVLGAYAHQEIPGPFLTRVLMPKLEDDELMSTNFSLPFVFFDVRSAVERTFQMDGLSLNQIEIPPISAGSGLGVTVTELDDIFKIAIIYSPDRYESSGVEQMLLHYQTVLKAIVRNPEERLSNLPLTT